MENTDLSAHPFTNTVRTGRPGVLWSPRIGEGSFLQDESQITSLPKEGAYIKSNLAAGEFDGD